MKVQTAIGVALLFAGLLLLYFGVREADSLASDVSELVTGSPTDRSMWRMVGGAAIAAFGGFLALAGRKS